MSINRETRRIYRPRSGRMIAGVAQGLGDYMSLDATLIRIIFLAFLFFGGAGLFAYMIAWILIPETPFGGDNSQTDPPQDSVKVIGIILIVLAVIFLISHFRFAYSFLPVGWLAPFALLAIGAAILLRPSVHSRSESNEDFIGAGKVDGLDVDDPKVKSESEQDNQSAQDGSSSEAKKDKKTRKSIFDDDDDRLKRSRNDKIFLGICGGIGEKYHVDGTLVRVLFAIAATMSFGIMLFAYIAMGIVIPEGK